MKVFNYPQKAELKDYDEAIELVKNSLISQKGLVSIYQIGSISDLGISDIDIVAVFEDGYSYYENPLELLPINYKNLFTHSIFGLSRTHFLEAQKYTICDNYKLLYGENIVLSNDNIDILKKEIALEFLLVNYIKKTIELNYKLFDLRGSMLSIKALQYDFQFLNISEGKIVDLVEEIVKWRKHWFEESISEEDLKRWFKNFYNELQNFLSNIFIREKIFLPNNFNIQYSQNIQIINSPKFYNKYSGWVLHPSFINISNKVFRLQHRFNKFSFYIPIENSNKIEILDNRVKFYKSMKEYNLKYLPRFAYSFGGNFLTNLI